jgi:hypothetical protein
MKIIKLLEMLVGCTQDKQNQLLENTFIQAPIET